jgi:hypothetical protein
MYVVYKTRPCWREIKYSNSYDGGTWTDGCDRLRDCWPRLLLETDEAIASTYLTPHRRHPCRIVERVVHFGEETCGLALFS